MGWGASAKMKRIVCASATELHTDNKSADVLIYDMNAIGRSHFNYQSDVCPLEAVVRFWKFQIAPHQETHLFAFHFDSAHLIPPERQEFLQCIRYKEVERDVFPEEVKIDGRIYRRGQEPATKEEVKLMTRDFMPVSYQRMWSSRQGKAKLWRIISDLLIEFADKLTAKNTKYIIEPPQGGRITIPKCKSETKNWGEADQKATALVRELIKTEPESTISVCTIDWDMIIAGTCCFNKNVNVKISRIYREKNTSNLFFSAVSAKNKSTERVNEYIYPALVGPQSCAWWMLALGGVDYCKGLTRFGFTSASILELIQEEGIKPLILKKNRMYGIDLKAVFSQLKKMRVLRRKVECPREFMREIKAMTFCMLYFLGCGEMNPRAGPDMSTFSYDISNCETIECVLSLKQLPPFFRPI